MTSPSRLVVLSFALAAAACATSKPYNPFKVPRESFYPSLKVVALAPLKVPTDLDNPEPVRARYLQLVEGLLQEAGLRVVAPAEVGPIMDEQAAKLGGLFDPVTGKPDEAKTKRYHEAIAADLRSRGADALLRCDVRVVAARLDHDQARWDGMSENAGVGGFWKALLATHSGTIPALSFVARLSDLEGKLLYAKGGGIQILVEVKLNGETVPVPNDKILASDERIVGSVHLALDPLVGRQPAPEPPPQ